MNKMIKFLVVGATVINFAANVNAMDDQANLQELQKVEAKKTADRRRTLIKYTVGSMLVAAAGATIAADFYFNDGKNTKAYVIEPTKKYVLEPGQKLIKSGLEYLSSFNKNVVSHGVETEAPKSSWFSSVWNKVPSLNTVKNNAQSLWNKMPAMPTWLSKVASKSVEVANEKATQELAQELVQKNVKTALSTFVL